MKNFFKYARVDFYRAICSRRFIIGIVVQLSRQKSKLFIMN